MTHMPVLQTNSGQPSISQIPQMPSANGRVTTAEAVPCFPSRIARPTDARPLQQSDSIRSQDDDPDIATPLNLGSVCNTVVAQYEFKYLEFARPTRMVCSPGLPSHPPCIATLATKREFPHPHPCTTSCTTAVGPPPWPIHP